MYDLHCHLLPNIDDGPKSLDDALALASLAVANGITHSVVTPHIHPGRYENQKETIAQAFQAFHTALSNNNIELTLGFCAEVRLSAEILPMIVEQQIPFYDEVDGYHIMLLELPHGHIPPGSDKLVSWLLDKKIRPMIAHPERNKSIMENHDRIMPFAELGCYFQLTAGAIAGNFGKPSQKTAIRLLEQGYANIIASDAHNYHKRPPELMAGVNVAAEIIGHEAAMDLVTKNPHAISQTLFKQA